MTGALYSGRCYASATDAASAAFTGVAPVVTDGGELRLIEHDAGAWRLNTYDGGVLIASAVVPVPAFQSCDPVQVLVDGVEMGFYLAGVWIVAFGFLLLRRQAR